MPPLSLVEAVLTSVLSVSAFLAFTAFCYDGGEFNLVRALVAVCCTISLCFYGIELPELHRILIGTYIIMSDAIYHI